MQKLYYTDPLAAAYMAREFGVKFKKHPQGTDTFESIITEYADEDGCYQYPILLSPYIIDNDSLHIFEPMVGDLMQLPSKGTWIFGSACVGEFSESKIIQRQGEPFFWPESEAARG